MTTELLMTVGEIMPDGGEEGKRITGGALPQYPADDLSWLDFRGKDKVFKYVVTQQRRTICGKLLTVNLVYTLLLGKI